MIVNVHPGSFENIPIPLLPIADIYPPNSSSSWGLFRMAISAKFFRVEVEPANNFFGPKLGDFNVSLRDVYGNVLPSHFCHRLSSVVTKSGSDELVEGEGEMYAVRIVPFSNITANAVCTVSCWFKKLGEYDLRIIYKKRENETVATQGIRVVHGTNSMADMHRSSIVVAGTGVEPNFNGVYLKFRIKLRDEFDNPINEVRWEYVDLRVSELCEKRFKTIQYHATVERVGEGLYDAYHFLMYENRPCSNHSLEMKLVDGNRRILLHKWVPIKGLWKKGNRFRKKNEFYKTYYQRIRVIDYGWGVPFGSQRLNMSVRY